MFWAVHVVHYQNRFFNLTVGLRTSPFVPIFNFAFYIPFPFLGFSPDAILFVVFIQGIYQLFLHTETIGKLGILEFILVTPSAHRVHHGTNIQYLDRNYGKVLLIWDFLFRTYQPEEEKVRGILQQEKYVH